MPLDVHQQSEDRRDKYGKWELAKQIKRRAREGGATDMHAEQNSLD